MMKRPVRELVIMLIIVATVIPGCKTSKKNLTQFSLKFSREIIIPSTVGVNVPFSVNTPQLTTNTLSEFERHGTNASLVERISLRQVRLKLSEPVNGNFSFLKTVRLYIAADGLPETLVAWYEEIPNSIGKELELQTTNADMKAYLIKDKIAFRINVVPDKLIASEHRIDFEATFFVDARVFGL